MQSVLQSSQLLQRLACNQQILMLSQVSLACGGVSFVAAVLGENIGNLVCPAEFDTGANFNLTILSVPEGDDKPAKYPLMYEVSDVLVINKIDA